MSPRQAMGTNKSAVASDSLSRKERTSHSKWASWHVEDQRRNGRHWQSRHTLILFGPLASCFMGSPAEDLVLKRPVSCSVPNAHFAKHEYAFSMSVCSVSTAPRSLSGAPDSSTRTKQTLARAVRLSLPFMSNPIRTPGSPDEGGLADFGSCCSECVP